MRQARRHTLRCWLSLVASLACCAWALRADAKMMMHFDLAGLALASDAIVLADRSPPVGGQPARYKLVRVLHGKAAVGDELVLEDSLYDLQGVDARVVLFLYRQDGKVGILPSGIRCVDHGKVFRFEQWNNPGGWTRVPQGTDPQDQWIDGTPQLDLPGLERAIAAAIQKVDALAVARKELDPARRRAALLALLAPATPAGTSRGGFYVDKLAAAVKSALAERGDLEGVLLAESQDHTDAWRRQAVVERGPLADYALDARHDVSLRANALGILTGFGIGAVPVRRLLPLLDDPSASIRAMAVAVVARQATDDDRALQSEVREAIVKRYRGEQSPEALFAIVDEYTRRFRAPLPARRDGRTVVARARIESGHLQVDVLGVPSPQREARAELTAVRDGKAVTAPRYVLSYLTSSPNGSSGGGLGAGGDLTPAPGVYEVSLSLVHRGRRTTQALGAVTVAPNQWWTLTPPASARDDLALVLKIATAASATQPVAITIEHRNTGKAPRDLYVREGCPGMTLDTVLDGDRPLKLDWMGHCGDNYWVHKLVAPGEAHVVEYTVTLPRGTHRLRARYAVQADSLVYDKPGKDTWLGRAESALVTVEVK